MDYPTNFSSVPAPGINNERYLEYDNILSVFYFCLRQTFTLTVGTLSQVCLFHTKDHLLIINC